MRCEPFMFALLLGSWLATPYANAQGPVPADCPVTRPPDPPTNGKLATGWAMLVMLELPTEGCWEVTGTYRSESVSMVVYVPRFEPKE